MRRITLLILVLVAMSTFIAGPVAGASPHAVDPASLTPPINPSLSPTCWETGEGVICQGSNDESYTNLDVGLRCDNQVIWVSGVASDQLTRWHLPDGRATKAFGNKTFTETWSLSLDGSGPSIDVTGRSVRHYTYLVPGDSTQRQLTESGATTVASAPGVGVVFRDAGQIVYEIGAENDFQSPTEFRGPHDTWTDGEAAVARACEVLAP